MTDGCLDDCFLTVVLCFFLIRFSAMETIWQQPDGDGEGSDASYGARRSWMAVLALSLPHDLAAALADVGDLPEVRWLRRGEIGMVMVQGRIGGTGRRFNVGEVTVTRCACALPNIPNSDDPAEILGVAYIRGRDKGHAEHAAIVDALMQRADWHDRLQEGVIKRLDHLRRTRISQKAAETMTSKVDFYTMVRGDNG